MKNKPYPLYELPPIRSLNEMALIKAQEMPEQTAFSFSENNTLRCKSYRELYSEMIALAAWLYLTEPRGTHIAILGENSYEWILVFLAVVSSGHVAVPSFLLGRSREWRSVTDLPLPARGEALIMTVSVPEKMGGFLRQRTMPEGY